MSGASSNGRHAVSGSGKAVLTEPSPVAKPRRRGKVSPEIVEADPVTSDAPSEEPDRSYIPSDIELKAELWRIGTGPGTESSRVSALRALADILGLMRPTAPEMPPGMSMLLDALALGLDSKSE